MNVEWGQGRVEVIAARDEILAAFADGRSIKSIYAELKAAKRVSLGYDGFYRHAKTIREARNNRPPVARGQGRVEVIALRSQVRAGISEGRTLKSIYDALKAESLVSAGYRAFHRNVRKFCGPPELQASNPLSTVPSSQPPTPPSNPAASPLSQPPSSTPPDQDFAVVRTGSPRKFVRSVSMKDEEIY